MASGGRHGARRLLMQALYQQQITGDDRAALRAQFEAADAWAHADGDYFHAVLNDVFDDRAALDACIDARADRPLAQLDPVERAILWIGAAELRSHADVPTRVVINEAVELAKEFGAQDSYRYINAILDGAAKDLR